MRAVPPLVAGLALAALASIAGCGVEIGAPAPTRPDEAGQAPMPVRVAAERFPCPSPRGPLASSGSIATPAPIDRLLPVRGTLLAVADDRLLELARGRWTPILAGGRDYDVEPGRSGAPDTIARLIGERIELFARPRDQAPRRIRSVPGRGHDASLALGEDAIFVHSAVDRGNRLLHRRSRETGEIDAGWVPVERDFVHAFFHDFEALLGSASRVRAAGRWVALVPLLRNPIRLVDLDRLEIYELHTPVRREGRVVRLASEVLRDERLCPTCTRNVHEVSSHRYESVHADAAFGEGSLWVLASERPGVGEAFVYRFPLDPPSATAAEGYRLAGLGGPPRALAVRPEHIIVAAGGRLHRFDRPRGTRGRSPAGGVCDDDVGAPGRGAALRPLRLRSDAGAGGSEP